MALRPLHVWQLDDQGNPKRDRHGDKIPHSKLNSAKTYKEMSPAERESFDDSNRRYDMAQHARAAHILGEIEGAQRVVAQGQK